MVWSPRLSVLLKIVVILQGEEGTGGGRGEPTGINLSSQTDFRGPDVGGHDGAVLGLVAHPLRRPRLDLRAGDLAPGPG